MLLAIYTQQILKLFILVHGIQFALNVIPFNNNNNSSKFDCNLQPKIEKLKEDLQNVYKFKTFAFYNN